MRWSRIKDIIILMLVVVNLFLLGMVGLRAWRSQRAQEESRERMVAVLEKNGVSFLPQEVPGQWSLPGQTPALEPGRELLTASTALLRFLDALKQEGYVCSQVTEVYAALWPPEGEEQTPVWIIETDTWPWRFAVDAGSGTVSTVE